MNFLANENFPRDAVDALRALGHDVAWVRTDAPGSTDPQVLARAVAEARILLTFDKDFGDLAFLAGLPTGCGIVLFRLPAGSSAQLAAHVCAASSPLPRSAVISTMRQFSLERRARKLSGSIATAKVTTPPPLCHSCARASVRMM